MSINDKQGTRIGQLLDAYLEAQANLARHTRVFVGDGNRPASEVGGAGEAAQEYLDAKREYENACNLKGI